MTVDYKASGEVIGWQTYKLTTAHTLSSMYASTILIRTLEPLNDFTKAQCKKSIHRAPHGKDGKQVMPL